MSVLDFLTTSDVAHTLWQYMNSYGHRWEDKIKNKSMGDGRWRQGCGEIGQMAIPIYQQVDGINMDDEGYKMWKICLVDWLKKL